MSSRVSELQAQQSHLRADASPVGRVNLLQEQQRILKTFLLGRRAMPEDRGRKIGRLRREQGILKDRAILEKLNREEERESRRVARELIKLRRQGRNKEASMLKRDFMSRTEGRIPASALERRRRGRR